MTKPVSDKRHRFPPPSLPMQFGCASDFPLGLRLVEKMLLERGIVAGAEE